MVHVPFKGQGPALTDVLGGHTTLMMGNLLSALPQVKSGRLRAFGVTSAKRAAVAPDIPTIAEAGVPRFEVVQWFGVLAPAAHAAGHHRQGARGDRAHAAGPRCQGAFRERRRRAGRQHARRVRGVIRADLKKWEKVIRDAGIKLEGARWRTSSRPRCVVSSVIRRRVEIEGMRSGWIRSDEMTK